MVGTVLRAQSGFFWVRLDESGEILRCTLRGRLKKEKYETDLATIGDRVRVARTVPGEGVIEAVEPRRTKLSRRAPLRQGGMRESVIVANLDLLVATFAIAHPDPHRRMIDRFLVIAEANGVEAAVVANKLDLCSLEYARSIFGDYERIGYPVFYTSAKTGEGIDELRDVLKAKISAFTGPSGVGKSSLLNAIQPGLGLKVGEVSGAVNKGRHTTVAPELHPTGDSGYVADTPGIRELGLWRIPPENLDWYFREFRPYLDDCAFDDCAHGPEPGCAVRAAVGRGEISQERYESYLRLLEQAEEEREY
ncbi:MAG: putative ribosome biogenesis GTPase RsgA [Herpetosiphonaceae bacterium]|nr:MAG: putative ribosome biogenesis GTPase RsgA [Herpetosiphonaceae bacterium]